MFQLVYCVGGSLKNLCHFEMGGGGLTNADVIRGGGLLNADRGEGGKICQNLADVICERSLTSASRPLSHYSTLIYLYSIQ